MFAERISRLGLTPRHVAVVLLAAFAVVAMLLTSGQMADLRVALPRLGRVMNWLEFLPLPFATDHVVSFGLIASVFRMLLPRTRWWWLLLGLTGLAASTELLQFGTIGRTPKLMDMRDDIIGASFGLLLGGLALMRFDRLGKSGDTASIGGMTETGAYGGCGALRNALAGWLTGREECMTTEAVARHGMEALSLSVGEGVLVLLHDADPPLPREIKSALRSMTKSEVAFELARGAEARRVLEALRSAELRVLSLKGTALAYWLYAHPAQRPRSDLDLLVSNIDEARRAVLVLQALGYEVIADVAAEDSAEFEIALEYHSPMGTAHVVDLHWRLLNHALLTKGFDFEEIWEQSQPIVKLTVSARGLGHLHALLHALLHRVTNIPNGNHNRLVWLYDIHLLARGMAAGHWSALIDTSGGRGIATPVLDGLTASVAMLGTEVPDHVMKALATLAADERWALLPDASIGALDRAHFKALTRRQKLAWLRRKLFPSRKFMRHRYGVEGLPSLVGAYLRRWWVGMRRGLGD